MIIFSRRGFRSGSGKLDFSWKLEHDMIIIKLIKEAKQLRINIHEKLIHE